VEDGQLNTAAATETKATRYQVKNNLSINRSAQSSSGEEQGLAAI